MLGADAISARCGRCHSDECQLDRDQQSFERAERQGLLRFGRQGGQRVCLGRDRRRCGALPPRAPAVLIATIFSSWIAVPGLLTDQTKWLVHI